MKQIFTMIFLLFSLSAFSQEGKEQGELKNLNSSSISQITAKLNYILAGKELPKDKSSSFADLDVSMVNSPLIDIRRKLNLLLAGKTLPKDKNDTYVNVDNSHGKTNANSNNYIDPENIDVSQISINPNKFTKTQVQINY